MVTIKRLFNSLASDINTIAFCVSIPATAAAYAVGDHLNAAVFLGSALSNAYFVTAIKLMVAGVASAGILAFFPLEQIALS